MLKRYLATVVVILAVAASCNSNRQKDPEKVADHKNEEHADTAAAAATIEADSKFVVKATSGVSMEVELGSYAAEHAVTPGVKQFGKMMFEDHSRDKEILTKLAAQKNIAIPFATGNDFQKHIDEITGKKGIDFDKAYISFMVGDHKDDISEFEEEVKKGNDAEIKAFAAKGIPVLQHHLDMANTLNSQLK